MFKISQSNSSNSSKIHRFKLMAEKLKQYKQLAANYIRERKAIM